MKKFLVAIPVALMALSAQAQQPGGELDGYIWKAGADANGFGLKGMIQLAPLFVDGQFQTGEVGAADVDEIRLGAGIMGRGTPQVTPYVKGELVNIDMDGPEGDETGIGIQAGVQWKPAPGLTLRTQVGYIDVAAFDGSEFLYGLSWEVMRPLSVLIERRESGYQVPVGGGMTLPATAETRFGVRVNF